jgi:glycosyltransferase involved in cell wall biosynthesis
VKLIVTMKLSDRNLLYHIYPLSLVEDIKKIIIIRDHLGPDIKRVKYICPPKWALKFPPLAFFIKMLQLIYISIRERPAFIHSFLLFPHGILALIAAKLTGSKAGVSLIAGPVELYAPGDSPDKKYAYTTDLPPLTYLGKNLLKVVNQFDIITVAGSYTREFLLDYGIPAKKIFYIPYIIIDEKCRPSPMQKTYDLIYVGRLTPSKHIDIGIYAIKKLIDDYGLTNIKFAIVGEGPCREKLEALSRYLKLSENIEFLGYQSDIAKHFNKAKLSIVTSERETGPLTAIESMMCGVPVVSSRCGDTVNDLIRDGIDGYLIDSYGDYSAFAEKIAHLLADDALLLAFSQNAMNSPNIIGIDSLVNLWDALIDATNVKDFEKSPLQR